MGTGISVDRALDFPVERVVVTELSDDIVEASRTYFEAFLNGLFNDQRVEIVSEDGRNFLFGVDERFDVVIADLFLAAKSGVGDLYTREHFESVRARLAPGGIFAQWLPMGYLTEEEFAIIARTMLEVFPRVSVWRRGFSVPSPAIALIGENEAHALDAGAFRSALLQLTRAGRIEGTDPVGRIPFALYAGDLATLGLNFSKFPLNTDDKPVIEYLAPVANREFEAPSRVSLAELYAKLLEAKPPEQDPYLEELTDDERKHVYAGLELFSFLVARQEKDASRAGTHLQRFRDLTGINLALAR